ncbi:hypothetical protein FRC02_005361 [Tulasnella sp. 418]|nr:hypothetical protein FRC02_005361 [Tulasnella sp. 418]
MERTLATSLSFTSTFQCDPGPPPGPGGLGDPGLNSFYFRDHIPTGASLRMKMRHVMDEAGMALRSSDIKERVVQLNSTVEGNQYPCPKQYVCPPVHGFSVAHIFVRTTINNYLSRYPEFTRLHKSEINDLWEYIPEECTSARGQPETKNSRQSENPEKGPEVNQQPLVSTSRQPTPALEVADISHSTFDQTAPPTHLYLNLPIQGDPFMQSFLQLQVTTAPPEFPTSPQGFDTDLPTYNMFSGITFILPDIDSQFLNYDPTDFQIL